MFLFCSFWFVIIASVATEYTAGENHCTRDKLSLLVNFFPLKYFFYISNELAHLLNQTSDCCNTFGISLLFGTNMDKDDAGITLLGSSKLIKMAALGRRFELGNLYNYRTDAIISGESKVPSLCLNLFSGIYCDWGCFCWG